MKRQTETVIAPNPFSFLNKIQQICFVETPVFSRAIAPTKAGCQQGQAWYLQYLVSKGLYSTFSHYLPSQPKGKTKYKEIITRNQLLYLDDF